MQNKPLISIIIPMYNVEKYIIRCIESCIYQSLKNIEIIIVDDCSSDNSLNLVNQYKDKRIKIIKNKINYGTFKTRIEGLEASNGEYILFLDGDDYIKPNTCEILNNTINKYKDLDVVFFGMEFYPKTRKRVPPPVIIEELQNGEILKAVFAHCATPPWHIWAKLYKASHILHACRLIVAHMGDFEQLHMAEDVLKSFAVLAIAKKSIGIKDKLYVYCNNQDSITNKIDKNTINKKINDLNRIIKYLDRFEEINEIKNNKYFLISKIKTQNILKATMELEYRYATRGGADNTALLKSLHKINALPHKMANICKNFCLHINPWKNQALRNLNSNSTLKSIRILFIRTNPINPDNRVQKSAFSLSKLNTKVSILAWDRDRNIDSIEEVNNIKIHRIGIKSTYGAGLKIIFQLMKFQIKELIFLFKNRKNIDCIHACDFDTILPAFLIAKIYKKILIYDIFDYYVDTFQVPKLLKPFIKYIDSIVINNVDACIICSKQRIKQINPAKPKNLGIVHNSPDNFVLKNNFQLKSNAKNKIKIAYVGIFSYDRYLEDLLELISKNQHLELHIAGFGILQNIVEKYATNSKNIYFYGKIPYSSTLELESKCDIITALYSPKIKNHIFAAPNKFYESLMLGKPIIMIKNTGMSEVVESNNIGEVIEFSALNLKNAIEKIAKSENENKINLRKQIYRNEFSWEAMEEELFRIYRIFFKKI